MMLGASFPSWKAAQPIAAECLNVSRSCAMSYSSGEATLGQMPDLKGVSPNALRRIVQVIARRLHLFKSLRSHS